MAENKEKNLPLTPSTGAESFKNFISSSASLNALRTESMVMNSDVADDMVVTNYKSLVDYFYIPICGIERELRVDFKAKRYNPLKARECNNKNNTIDGG